MFRKFILFWSIIYCAWAQQPTRVSILNQTKDFDLSTATKVKPFPLSAQLPATCSVGETIFRTDVAAGQNVYACTATNTWTQQGFASVLDPGFVTTRTASNTLSIGSDCSSARPCLIRIGSVIRTFTQPATLTVSGNGTGTVYIFVNRSGNLTIGATPQSTLSLNCTNCTVGTQISDFPVDSVPLGRWTSSVGGAWDSSGIDQRAVLSVGRRVVAGNNITVAEAGSDITISTTNFMPSGSIINNGSFRLGAVIPASATESLLGVGNAISGGASAGTAFGINTAAGYSGDLAHWMVNGTSVMKWGIDGSQSARSSGQLVSWTGNSATGTGSGFRLAIAGTGATNQFQLGAGGGRTFFNADGTGGIGLGHNAPAPANADLLIQDVTASTGSTQVQIKAGEGQSGDLLQIMDFGGNVLTRITGQGALSLLPTGTRPVCGNSNRGMLWVTVGGAAVADKIEICVKSAADTYGWTALF